MASSGRNASEETKKVEPEAQEEEEIILLVGDNDDRGSGGGGGGTLVLNNEGNQQLLSGFGPDILQQALAEVTSEVVSGASSAGETANTISDQEFSLILNGGGANAVVSQSSNHVQDFLLSLPEPLGSQPSSSSSSNNTLSLTELDLNSLLSSTTSSTATISSSSASCQISPRKDGFVTVLKGSDGSLQVLSDPNHPVVSAQALTSNSAPALKRTTTILQPMTSGSNSNSPMSIPVIRVQPQPMQQQQQQQPRVIQTIIQAPPQQQHHHQQAAGNVILVPTTAPDGTVTYVLKSEPRAVCAPVPIQRLVPLQRHQRPAAFGRKVLAGSAAQTTPILRPVMSAGVAKTSVGQVKTYHNQQPLILPKMPVVAPRQVLGRTAHGGHGQVVPVVFPRARSNSKPLGSTENPIQLIQEGSTFRYLQLVS